MASTVRGRWQRAALGPRTLTAVVGIPLLVAALWVDGPWWIAVTAVIALLASEELARIHALAPSRQALLVLLTAVVFGAVLTGGRMVVAVIIASWSGLIVSDVVTRLSNPEALGPPPPTARPYQAALVWFVLGPLYLAVPTALLARWRLQLPPESILAFLLIIWANDTAAYFVGIAAGRHKLAPRISPGKSWEGAIAGTAAGAVAAALASSWLGLPVAGAVVLGVLVTIVSQTGALLESAMKRKAGVKDAGTILPGHGGVLDRFDGILLAAPAAYILVRLWGGR